MVSDIAQHIRRTSLWCGRCHVESQSRIPIKILTDDRPGIVDLMHRIVFHKWTPPTTLTQADWNLLKRFKDELSPSMEIFCGYAYAQRGEKWYAYDDRRASSRNLGDEAWRGILRTGHTLDRNSDQWSIMHRESMFIPFPVWDEEHENSKIALYINIPPHVTVTTQYHMWLALEEWLQGPGGRTAFISLPQDPKVRFLKRWVLPTVYATDNIYKLEGDLRLKL